MCIGTINFYHFTWILVTLTVAGGHKVCRKHKLLTAVSWTLFSWWAWSSAWCWGNIGWTSWYYFWMGFIEWRGKNCGFTNCLKNTYMLVCIQMFMNWFGSTMRLNSTFCYWSKGLWFWLKVTGVQENKHSLPVIWQSMIWMKFNMMLRHVGVMNFILGFHCIQSIFGCEPCVCAFIQKSYSFGLYSYSYTQTC